MTCMAEHLSTLNMAHNANQITVASSAVHTVHAAMVAISQDTLVIPATSRQPISK